MPGGSVPPFGVAGKEGAALGVPPHCCAAPGVVVITRPAVTTILVVDDDPLMRELYEAILAEEGYTVRLARDGLQALQVAAQYPPQLIVLDLQMPWMSGWDFLRERLQRPQLQVVPVIPVTARTPGTEQLEGLNTAPCVHKPFELDDLLQHVRAQLEPLPATATR